MPTKSYVLKVRRHDSNVTGAGRLADNDPKAWVTLGNVTDLGHGKMVGTMNGYPLPGWDGTFFLVERQED